MSGLPDVFMRSKYDVGDKVLVTDGDKDDEKVLIGSVCTVLKVVYVIPYCPTRDQQEPMYYAYYLEEYPKVGPFAEKWLSHPPPEERLIFDDEFNSMFGG